MATAPETKVLVEAVSAFTPYLRNGYENALFAKMQGRAERDAGYAANLIAWIKRGSTLKLRELAEPFGDYWRNLDFANVVDGLDSAKARAGTIYLAQVSA